MYVDAFTIAAWFVVAASLAASIVLAVGSSWFDARRAQQAAAAAPVDSPDKEGAVAQEANAANDRDRFSDAA